MKVHLSSALILGTVLVVGASHPASATVIQPVAPSGHQENLIMARGGHGHGHHGWGGHRGWGGGYWGHRGWGGGYWGGPGYNNWGYGYRCWWSNGYRHCR